MEIIPQMLVFVKFSVDLLQRKRSVCFYSISVLASIAAGRFIKVVITGNRPKNKLKINIIMMAAITTGAFTTNSFVIHFPMAWVCVPV